VIYPDNRRGKPRRSRRTDSRFDTGITSVPKNGADSATSSPALVRTLSAIAEHAKWDSAIRRTDLSAGDRVVVTTRNSTYSMWVLDDDAFAVTGGWFDRQGTSPVTVRINGCTYGQSAIRHDVVAAPGLFLEFSNNVRTTRIQNIRVLRYTQPALVH
jgi:hypothetical protein